MSIDLSLLDVNMDSVEDAKGFELPPNGTYECLLSLEVKEINNNTYVVWNYTVVEPIKLDDEDAEVPNGATFNQLMGLAKIQTKDGKSFDPRSRFKIKTTYLAEQLGVANTMANLVENVQNLKVNCYMSVDKKGYAQVADNGFELA